MFENISIPTYIINLNERQEQLAHAYKQFEGKPEFELHRIEACRHENGAFGLWESIVKTIRIANEQEDDVIIICEDDHTFTEQYDRNNFISHILEASGQGVELLLGGIGGFGSAVPVTANRYWIDWFRCTQFMVLYRPVFQKILQIEFTDKDKADSVFSTLTTHKIVICPFISVQHDFGYSDVILSNQLTPGKITQLFREAEQKMEIYRQTYLKYFS